MADFFSNFGLQANGNKSTYKIQCVFTFSGFPKWSWCSSGGPTFWRWGSSPCWRLPRSQRSASSTSPRFLSPPCSRKVTKYATTLRVYTGLRLKYWSLQVVATHRMPPVTIITFAIKGTANNYENWRGENVITPLRPQIGDLHFLPKSLSLNEEFKLRLPAWETGGCKITPKQLSELYLWWAPRRSVDAIDDGLPASSGDHAGHEAVVLAGVELLGALLHPLDVGVVDAHHELREVHPKVVGQLLKMRTLLWSKLNQASAQEQMFYGLHLMVLQTLNGNSQLSKNIFLFITMNSLAWSKNTHCCKCFWAFRLLVWKRMIGWVNEEKLGCSTTSVASSSKPK